MGEDPRKETAAVTHYVRRIETRGRALSADEPLLKVLRKVESVTSVRADRGDRAALERSGGGRERHKHGLAGGLLSRYCGRHLRLYWLFAAGHGGSSPGGRRDGSRGFSGHGSHDSGPP